jgi:predicted AlkP superfamily phosphohydrolase/phosphomutase
MTARVLVIGLDCAPPALVFERYRDAMPNVARLMDTGTWGPMRSSVPPITVPAWTCMVSGRDPGELGLYGFRNLVRGSYELALPTSRDVTVKRVWDLLGEAGKRVAPLFVPLTWPPTPVRGAMISCFLTPSSEAEWAFPRALRAEIEERFGAYQMDVPGYRTDDPRALLEGLYASGRQRFAIARHVWETRQPDFMMMVEMGPDRLHHAMWQHLDPAHPRYVAGNPYEDEGRRYYAFLDAEIGALLALAGEDLADTTVLVVSDHGARAMEGGVAVNELLRREGWLALREEPRAPAPLTPSMVDWSRTRAWGEGGYYARVFLNVEGREPEGIVPARRVEAERDALAALLRGVVPGTRVVAPSDEYRETRGAPPDLMAFFGDLRYRSVGSVGLGTVMTETNDTGPDGANHDWNGIFVMAGGGAPARGRVEGIQIYDVARTVLGRMGVSAPPGLLGVDRSAA